MNSRMTSGEDMSWTWAALARLYLTRLVNDHKRPWEDRQKAFTLLVKLEKELAQ